MKATPGPTTIADLEKVPDEDGYRYDLVRGWLVREPPPGGRHGEIAAEMIFALVGYAKRTGQGRVFSNDTGFVLAEDPPTVRGPDVAFVAAGRLPSGSPEGLVRLAPDLAVEVVSPSNRWTDVAAKVGDYLDAGTRLVWVVDPPRSTITVHAPGRIPSVHGPDETIGGGDVLPGFEVDVGSIFGS